MVPIIKIVLLFASLATASGALVPMTVKELESSKSNKLVVFHDPNVEKSVLAVGVMERLDTAGTYEAEYQYTLCDVTTPENVDAVKGHGFKEFPVIFTQTLEGGIEPYSGDLTLESFARHHEFRIMHISSDNVRRVKDSSGIGDVDGTGALMAIAAERPVLIKLYETWCGHCKKMLKHFQFVSNIATDTINNAVLVEAECSKVGGTFCNDFGVTGFPTVALIYQNQWMKYPGARTHEGMTVFLGDKSKWIMEDLPLEIVPFLPVVSKTGSLPDSNSPTTIEDTANDNAPTPITHAVKDGGM
ncbi:hypothetical protein T484DRAFT_1757514 [Baffinella frigidus]|nr:hypothetical protein T484DRAFT_1757514 [Cryptophyta sp. CCMP2293]